MNIATTTLIYHLQEMGALRIVIWCLAIDDRYRLCRYIYYLRSIVSRGICGSIVLLAVINPTQWAISQNIMLLITLVHYIPAEPGKNRAHAFYNVSCVCLARRGNSYAWVCTNEHFIYKYQLQNITVLGQRNDMLVSWYISFCKT